MAFFLPDIIYIFICLCLENTATFGLQHKNDSQPSDVASQDLSEFQMFFGRLIINSDLWAAC